MQIILIPAFQPTGGLVALAEEIRRESDIPLLIVDDGSGEGFAGVFETVAAIPGVSVIRNAINLGKGAALKHGFNHILVSSPAVTSIVTADCDGQHLASDILAVAAAAERDRLVLGVREFRAGVPARSRLGNVLSKYLYWFFTGVKVSDTQTGLRSVPRKLAELCLPIRSNRYEFETEQLILAKERRLGFREIPIRTVYVGANEGSHFNPLFDSFKIYFVLLRYAASSAVTALTDLAIFALLAAQGASVMAANLGARGAALWIQFILLKRYVFKTRGGVPLFVAYALYVFLSGWVSALLQVQLGEALGSSLLLAKIVVESAIFCFNFLFLRDFVFRRWERVET